MVEIGGHKEYFTIYASVKAKKGKVYVFEPQPNNFTTLVKNSKLNKCNNVFPYQLGVSGTKGVRKFYLAEKGSSGATFLDAVYKNMSNISSFKAKCITLANIFKLTKIKKINFLKIDCEGAEFEILLRTSAKTLSLIDKISLEYHQVDNQKVEVLEKYLQKHNFKTKIFPQSSVICILCAKKSL